MITTAQLSGSLVTKLKKTEIIEFQVWNAKIFLVEMLPLWKNSANSLKNKFINQNNNIENLNSHIKDIKCIPITVLESSPQRNLQAKRALLVNSIKFLCVNYTNNFINIFSENRGNSSPFILWGQLYHKTKLDDRIMK